MSSGVAASWNSAISALPVKASLVHAAAMLGVHIHIASPDGYQIPHSVVQQATELIQ